jgi:uric acid-xanthine permease
MKSASVIGGLLVGCVIAGACGYFDSSGIDAAPAASFIWVHTFPLTVYGPLVLPTMILYVICACEAIGDITGMNSFSKNSVTELIMLQLPAMVRFLLLAQVLQS